MAYSLDWIGQLKPEDTLRALASEADSSEADSSKADRYTAQRKRDLAMQTYTVKWAAFFTKFNHIRTRNFLLLHRATTKRHELDLEELKDLVLYFVSQGANDWNWGMCGAACGGHLDLVLYFVSQRANDWNASMCWAAKGGHMDLVLYFVSQGANEWNCGMRGATYGKHEKLIEFFKSKVN